ncbi:MAG: carboxyl transferase domain-containing protein, partial [Acidimicrobiales bacterium]
MTDVHSPLKGTVVRVAPLGAIIGTGDEVVAIESMKMEHLVLAQEPSVVDQVHVAVGAVTAVGDLLVRLRPHASADRSHVPPVPSGERAALAEVRARHEIGLDEARPDAVERRRGTGQRTARENVGDLVDPDSFVEYGPLVIAGQRRRRTVEELIERTPADGLVGGVGTVAGRPIVAMSYDYTVLAGTQGLQNHRKKDRLFEVAEQLRLPVVFFTEGGGGRPGDTDGTGVSGLDCMAFALWGSLSGLVP